MAALSSTRRTLKLGLIVLAAVCAAALPESEHEALAQEQRPLGPAAWGSNHVGKPLPEFVHGDECLFCHRNDIGSTWQQNAHGVTVRQVEDAPRLRRLTENPAIGKIASEIEFVLGSRNRIRFLKKEGYGRFALLNTQAELGESGETRWHGHEKPEWDKAKFGDRCAGCHTTAVDSKAKTFAAFGLDCYTCHGSVTLEHTGDTSLIWLSKKRRSDVQAITSICAQCHLRGGRSRSSGLPYPNNFVAGDNLFQDFEVNFSLADDATLNPGDRHIYENVRDVVVNGKRSPSCLSCHQIHDGGSFKHRRVAKSAICNNCHEPEGPLKVVKEYVVTSSLCEY